MRGLAMDDGGGRLVSYDPHECVPMSGSIALDSESPGAVERSSRTYTFVHPRHGQRIYRVDPGEPPVMID